MTLLVFLFTVGKVNDFQKTNKILKKFQSIKIFQIYNEKHFFVFICCQAVIPDIHFFKKYVLLNSSQAKGYLHRFFK